MLEFCIRAAVSTTRQEAFETHRKLIDCGAHVFGVHAICIYSCRGSEKTQNEMM